MPIRVDDLDRELKLHITPDGTLTVGPLFLPEEPCGVKGVKPALAGDWRDAVIDMILIGDLDRAMAQLKSNRNEPLADEPPERSPASLPVFSVDTMEQARRFIVQFCQLQHEPLPDGQPWYRIPRREVGLEPRLDNQFSIEELGSIADKFRDFWNGYGRTGKIEPETPCLAPTFCNNGRGGSTCVNCAQRPHRFVRKRTNRWQGPVDETCEICGTDPRNVLHEGIQ